MACPTCGDMTCTADDRVPAWFWCKRCGTLVSEPTPGTFKSTNVPKLVEQCREFEETHYYTRPEGMSFWRSLGIAESIHKPEDRK